MLSIKGTLNADVSSYWSSKRAVHSARSHKNEGSGDDRARGRRKFRGEPTGSGDGKKLVRAIPGNFIQTTCQTPSAERIFYLSRDERLGPRRGCSRCGLSIPNFVCQPLLES